MCIMSIYTKAIESVGSRGRSPLPQNRSKPMVTNSDLTKIIAPALSLLQKNSLTADEQLTVEATVTAVAEARHCARHTASDWLNRRARVY